MALSSQGGLNFQQSRLQDSTESARGALTEFGSLAQRFQDNKLKAEALAEAKAQQALENKRADEMMAMRKSEFDMQKKQFDTAENTLRITSEVVPAMDKLVAGQGLLSEQATKLLDPLSARTTALAAKNGMTKEQFEQSDLMTKAVQAGAFADLTGVGAKEATASGSIGKAGQAMLNANAKDMNVQKRLLSEFAPTFLKPDSDEAMLYDSSQINKYRQDLLSGLDTRIHQKEVLDQNAAQHAASLAQSERHYRQSRADAKNAQSAAEQREAARLEAFGKSLIPAEKQTHKVYTKEFGEKILKPLQKLEEIKAKRESEAISDFSKDKVFKKSGLSIVNVNGKPTIVNPGGRPVNDYYVSEQQKKLDDTVFKKVAPDTGNGTLYTRIANLRKVALDADNPIHQKAYGYKFTGRKVGSDSLDNLVKLPGGNYKSDKPDYVKDPNAYSMLMTQMAINGIDQFGNPASADDITMARLWLLNEQQANVESSRELGRSNVRTVNTGLKPPKQTASDD